MKKESQKNALNHNLRYRPNIKFSILKKTTLGEGLLICANWLISNFETVKKTGKIFSYIFLNHFKLIFLGDDTDPWYDFKNFKLFVGFIFGRNGPPYLLLD